VAVRGIIEQPHQGPLRVTNNTNSNYCYLLEDVLEQLLLAGLRVGVPVVAALCVQIKRTSIPQHKYKHRSVQEHSQCGGL
jgi:hypothetical protein